jgi:hypothetical protein
LVSVVLALATVPPSPSTFVLAGAHKKQLLFPNHSTTRLEHACHRLNGYANACRLQGCRKHSPPACSTYVLVHEVTSSITTSETGQAVTCTRRGGQFDQPTSDGSTTPQAGLCCTHRQPRSRSADLPCELRILISEIFDTIGRGPHGPGDASHGRHNLRQRNSRSTKNPRVQRTRAGHRCYCECKKRANHSYDASRYGLGRHEALQDPRAGPTDEEAG